MEKTLFPSEWASTPSSLLWELQSPRTEAWNLLNQCCKTVASAPDKCHSEKEAQSLASVLGTSINRLAQDPLLFGLSGVKRSGGNILTSSSSTLVDSKAIFQV